MPVSDIPDNFEQSNINFNLISKIEELYGFDNFKNSYKFMGHSCGDVHLLIFGDKKIIFKNYKFKSKQQLKNIIEEKKLISVLSDFVPLQNLITNKNKLPYFIFEDKIIKLYEYIEGEKTDLYSCKKLLFAFLKFFICDNRVLQFKQDFKRDAILNKITKIISETKEYLLMETKNINIDNYIKAYNDQFDKISGLRKQVFVPYNNFEIIQDVNNSAVIETEHILENFYPINYCLARYIVDLINESNAHYLIDIDLILEEISQNINYVFTDEDIKQIKFLFLNELIYRIMKIKKYNNQTIRKFWDYFKYVNDKLY